MTIEISDACLEYVSNLIINSENYVGINKLSELLKNDEDFLNFFKENYTLRKDIRKSINSTTLNKVIFRKTNQNYFDFVLSIKPILILDKDYIKSKSIYLGKTKEKPLLNHKVVSVVKLNETILEESNNTISAILNNMETINLEIDNQFRIFHLNLKNLHQILIRFKELMNEKKNN